MIFLISGEFTEPLEIFITVRKHCWSEVRLIWPVSEEASHWESWRGRCRGGREPRGALLALASALSSGCQRLLKLTGSHRQEKKQNKTAVSGFISVISAQRAPRHEPLAACKAARTDTCLRIHRSQPSQSETELSSAARQPGDEQSEGGTAGA